jgi:cytochrome c oxidase cbb3-type subunit III
MKSACGIFGLAILACASMCACGDPPGKPAADVIPAVPNAISDFKVLYGANCAGCHGADGAGGAALALADPVYLAIVDDATLRSVMSNGIRGSSMPAFAQSAGGMLTEKQINLIVSGIREHWSKPGALQGATPPAYAAAQAGDGLRGAQVYAADCQSCHGPGGHGGEKASSIVDGSFLGLLNDQELRTIVIVGRPELGAPDWRNDVPGKPMSAQDVSDVVAWLASQRPRFPGQPYLPSGKSAGETP